MPGARDGGYGHGRVNSPCSVSARIPRSASRLTFRRTMFPLDSGFAGDRGKPRRGFKQAFLYGIGEIGAAYVGQGHAKGLVIVKVGLNHVRAQLLQPGRALVETVNQCAHRVAVFEKLAGNAQPGGALNTARGASNQKGRIVHVVLPFQFSPSQSRQLIQAQLIHASSLASSARCAASTPPDKRRTVSRRAALPPTAPEPP